MKVLITGIAGVLAKMVAARLVGEGHTVLGVDRRDWHDPPKGVQIFRADIRKRPAEDIFRTRRPEAVIHMATVTHFTTEREERYRINMWGTQKVFEHCHNYGVGQAVFVGRHTIYGASPDSPLYYNEADPPLAAATFPELSDLVAADLYAVSALWRWPEIDTAVLRLAYTLGPARRGTLANFLAGRRVPLVAGFDPLFQFMHDRDAADAIVTALRSRMRGVFNVAGPQPVPLSLLCKVTGRQPIPVLEPLLPFIAGRFGFAPLPTGAVAHVKYPIVVDDTAFRVATGFAHTYSEAQTMEAFREG